MVEFPASGQPAGGSCSRNEPTQYSIAVREYCLIVEGAFFSESEAEHALRDPFIEDWVEQTGRFRIHNMDEILITPGVTLGSLGVVMLDDGVFEIASTDPDHPLTEHKAKGVAEALRHEVQLVVHARELADVLFEPHRRPAQVAAPCSER